MHFEGIPAQIGRLNEFPLAKSIHFSLHAQGPGRLVGYEWMWSVLQYCLLQVSVAPFDKVA